MAKKGRPRREPTDDEREQVTQLVKEKAPIADIARILKRSEPNLRKYFSAELFSEKKSQRKPKEPEIKVTRLLQEKVIRYVGGNMTTLDVARALGFTEDQVKTHFAEELATGKARYRAKVLDHLDSQMVDGKAGATNKLEALTAAQPDPKGGPTAAGSGAGYVGKKALARAGAAAMVAGGGKFAPRAAPKLATVGGRPVGQEDEP